jgi:SAM-dependent methyltransferase
VALAELGARVVAIDASGNMIGAARSLATQRRVSVESFVMRMEDLSGLRPREFDLAICLGNSLSLLPDVETVIEVLKHTLSLLSSGGKLVFQVLNFEEIRRTGFWSFPPRMAIALTGEKLIFNRFFDHDDRGLASDLILLALRKSRQKWSAQVLSQRVLNLNGDRVRDCLVRAGFKEHELFGDFKRNPLDRANDRNIVVVAESAE